MPTLFQGLSSATVNALVKVFGLHKVLPGVSNAGSGKEVDDYINRAFSSLGVNGTFASAYNTYMKVERERRLAYREYDNMDEESELISTALDIYKEDATHFDTFVGARVWFTSENEQLAKKANDWLKQVKMEKKLPRIARNVAKYGDFMARVLTKENREKKASSGIYEIDTSYHPKDVIPVVKNRKLLGYWVVETPEIQQAKGDQLFPPWGFVHFALPGDSNFYTYDLTSVDFEARKREDMVEYGQSILKAARRPHKRSKLTHDILAISRMTRSPMKRVFSLQTETNNPVAQIRDLAIFKKTMEKIGGVDKLNAELNFEELMNLMTQDIYVPVGKDSKGDYSVKTIGGEVDVSSMVDVDLFDNRLFMSLRIPKEFLNFSTTAGEKSTLLLKDIRYAKRVSQIQNCLKSGVKELYLIHSAFQQEIVNEDDLEVNMASTSVSEDLERLDYYGSAVQTADSLLRMVTTFEGDGASGTPMDSNNPIKPEVELKRGYLIYYILKHIVKLPSFDVSKFYPGAKAYEEEKKTKKAQDTEDKVKKMVESNQKLIERIFKKSYQGPLQEAVEELNVGIEKCYKSKPLPEKLSYDHATLKNVITRMIEKRERREKANRV